MRGCAHYKVVDLTTWINLRAPQDPTAKWRATPLEPRPDLGNFPLRLDRALDQPYAVWRCFLTVLRLAPVNFTILLFVIFPCAFASSRI